MEKSVLFLCVIAEVCSKDGTRSHNETQSTLILLFVGQGSWRHFHELYQILNYYLPLLTKFMKFMKFILIFHVPTFGFSSNQKGFYFVKVPTWIKLLTVTRGINYHVQAA